MTVATYDSNCMGCLSGALHPNHDDGRPTTEQTGHEFRQLPREVETPYLTVVEERPRCTTCGCSSH